MSDLRESLATMTAEELKAESFEREIGEWRAVNRFCGRCGAAMRPRKNPAERAFVCPECGYTVYPRKGSIARQMIDAWNGEGGRSS